MKRVLVAPLDWGLGHATRCVPLIRELQRQGCEVMAAGAGDSLELLRREFADIAAFEIPGYRPRYPSDGSMAWAMARQLPRFRSVIAAEHAAISRLIERERLEGIISDNRYGCWSSKIPCAFITHQRNILMPRRLEIFQDAVRWVHEKLIDRFDVCWLPDVPGEQSMAGDLIFPETRGLKTETKRRTEYVGLLSRFTSRTHPAARHDVLVILSGPEPQRTLLEKKVLSQLKNTQLKYKVIRGLPFAARGEADARVVNFLASDELQAEIESAALVLARSGYSTVLDMHALGKKVVFIPTPGQTEQEYLARRLSHKRIAFHMEQNTFDLGIALEESRKFSGFTATADDTLLEEAVRRFLG